MDKWHLMHDYRKMVARGKMDPELCEVCGNPMSVSIDKDDSPMLSCWGCKINLHLLPEWYRRKERQLNDALRDFNL